MRRRFAGSKAGIQQGLDTLIELGELLENVVLTCIEVLDHGALVHTTLGGRLDGG